uniref:Uncharacterized protein n=1 Tax=Timema tahoe TaxID=61484 RepID=A0A7R9IJY0_9NEOP|nr:unnamed protein product [Timema tahoe]
MATTNYAVIYLSPLVYPFDVFGEVVTRGTRTGGAFRHNHLQTELAPVFQGQQGQRILAVATRYKRLGLNPGILGEY